MALTKQQVVDWLMRCGEVFSRERDFLTRLDTEIGDADHGLNMNRGFNKVVEKLPSVANKDIGFILKNTGMTLLSSVGGASGPLFGTFAVMGESLGQSAQQNLSVAEARQRAADSAERAVESTLTMQARKGRASYLGERSIGHQDPGATSVMLMMKTLAEVAGS